MGKKFGNWVTAAFCVNDIILLPAVVWTLNTICYSLSGNGIGDRTDVLRPLWIFLMMTLIFMRAFFLPYIFSAVLIGLAVFYLVKNKFPIGRTAAFVLLTAVCIFGLISVENVVDAAMSV